MYIFLYFHILFLFFYFFNCRTGLYQFGLKERERKIEIALVYYEKITFLSDQKRVVEQLFDIMQLSQHVFYLSTFLLLH